MTIAHATTAEARPVSVITFGATLRGRKCTAQSQNRTKNTRSMSDLVGDEYRYDRTAACSRSVDDEDDMADAGCLVGVCLCVFACVNGP
jgi:hypothetical protein